MISVQVIPDRFKASENTLLLDDGLHPTSASAVASEPHIRRPTRGIVLKEETFATLRVVAAGSGRTINIVDAGSRRGPGVDAQGNVTKFHEINGKRATDIYSNFFLQSIQEERQEKQQILETFGEPYIFLFGERARVLTFQGVLLNTFDFNWEAEWWYNYENYLRGTKCVEADARIFISFDETLVSGYILGTSATKDAGNPNQVNFQFQLFVTSYANFSRIGNPSAADAETTMRMSSTGEFNLTEETARQFRPTLIDPNDNESLKAFGGSVIQKAQITLMSMPNLIEGVVRSGLGPVIRTFKRAEQLTDIVMRRKGIGEVVQIPIGFEGSLAFDADLDEPLKLKEVTGAGRIVYSTFDENVDEYVGSGTHYGSAVYSHGGGGLIRADLDPSIEQRKATISETLDKAREIWAQEGLDAPISQLGPIAAFISNQSVGLLAAGPTAAWRTQNPLNSILPRIRG